MVQRSKYTVSGRRKEILVEVCRANHITLAATLAFTVSPCAPNIALFILDMALSLSNLDLLAELSASPTLAPPEKSDDMRLDDVVFVLIEGRCMLADPRRPVNDMCPIWSLPAFPI